VLFVGKLFIGVLILRAFKVCFGVRVRDFNTNFFVLHEIR
jgi:hypothetical protein